jgi:hypothetical protein
MSRSKHTYPSRIMFSTFGIAALIQCQSTLIELELAQSEAELKERRENTEVTLNLNDLDDRIKYMYRAQLQHIEERLAALEASIRRLESQR